jgi:uncharacterized protein with PCYCGC motif
MLRRRSIPLAALALACGLASRCDSRPPDRSAGTVPPPATSASNPTPAPAPPPNPPPVAAVDAQSADELPPLPLAPFPYARPPEVVRAVYTFAAMHPEVLSRVPCFCGCERRGHSNNDDCFVTARDARGRVTAWEPHGVG